MNFKNIYSNSESRLEECLLSLWVPGSHPMRKAIKELFKREPYIGEPHFQSAFGWEQISTAINWKTGFEPTVADMMERIGTDNYKRPWLPYTHQKQSWELLNNTTPGNAQSIVVTSGTGSGKTECFLYPVLNDMYKHKGEGVQAIFMYPLNALANDQKGRIEKCCKQLGIQFACYNGNTKHSGKYDPNATEILSRSAIREHRPDLLLTNPSMLEYIMVRDDDQTIMKPNNANQPTSSLRWIIIDEAHTYTGSAAVELKYEIKRVIEAFGAKMEDIHFACTSATIGKNPAALQQFIHELTGQDINRIHIIGGQRKVPQLSVNEIDFLLQQNNITITDANSVKTLRDKINQESFLSTQEIWEILFPHTAYSIDKISQLLDLVDQLCDISWMNGPVKEFLLMMRGHFFMREPEGLYVCLDPKCPHHSDSPMGYITSMDSQTCPHCGSPLFELCQCRSCHEFLYMAEMDTASHELRAIRTSEKEDFESDFSSDDDDNNNTGANNNSGVASAIINYKAGISASQNQNHKHLIEITHDLDFSGSKVKRVDSKTGEYITYVNQQRTEFCSHCAHLTSDNRISGFHLPMETLKQLVSPVLLSESTPNAGQFWGKYISFTDSRQKTAISAKRININVERDYALAKILEKLTEEHISKGVIQPVEVAQFKDIIWSKDIFDHIATDSSTEESYKAAVLRNTIGRRLLNASGSLETMGLVTIVYPALTQKSLPTVISTWNANNPSLPQITTSDWHDFLKICIDYVVRLGNCIQPLYRTAAPSEHHYLRNNSPTRINNNGGKLGKNWPSIHFENKTVTNTQSRIITLLCAALNISNEQELNLAHNQQLISCILDEAWKQLVGSDGTPAILSTDDNGNSYYLDMSADNPYSKKCLIKLNEYSSVCPVSNKLIDVTFMGYSPMMTGHLAKSNMDQYKCCCQKVKMPLLSLSQPSDALLEAWLTNNSEVKNLKRLGLWSNYMDNAFRFRNIFVAAEHSAQLDRSVLETYTNQFKGDPNTTGRLNILNCSTTMEMGVDIGDIDMVFLSNVPPAAANYLQRAGRAGRFGQSKAAAYTTCPATPDGMRTFFHPEELLVDSSSKQMPIESNVIIRRHINAFFFRDFVINGGMAVSGDSSAVDFFVPQGTSTCDAFIAHLNNIGLKLQPSFNKLFNSHSISYAAAINQTIDTISHISDDFINTYKELAIAIANAKSAASNIAISYQLTKFAEQNLIGFLSEMQFFPNANMPTGIVEFDASSKAQKEKITKLTGEIKDLRLQLNNKTIAPHLLSKTRDKLKQKKEDLKILKRSTVVTREARVALNEYAPGQTIVVNERNFASYALTDRSTYGNKSITKWISRCDSCGWTEYSTVSPGTQPRLCQHCNNGNMTSVGLRDGGNSTFSLARAVVGYSADYQGDEDRQEEITKHFYHISSFLPHFDWRSPQRIGLCDIKGKDSGTVVYCNKGDGFGFAVQKESSTGFPGRAVKDVQYTQKPPISGKGINWNNKAPYKSQQIDRHVILTCENTTSYAALRFFGDVAGKNILSTEAFLYSMGTILIKAACDYLALDYGEIAFDVNTVDGKNFLYIYDTNKGGSGYATRLCDPSVFEGVIKTAYNYVNNFSCNCKHTPGQACAKCLMGRGTYSYSGLLSTYDIYEWLRLEMKQFRTVSGNILSISPNCRYEPRTLKEILETAVESTDVTEIELFIPKENELIPSDWNDRNDVIGNLLRKARANGKIIKLYLEYDQNDKDITTLFRLYNTELQLGWFDDIYGAEFTGPIRSAIVIKDVNGDIQNFFTTEFDDLPLSSSWGICCDELYQDNIYPQLTILPLPQQNDIQTLLAGGKRKILDGTIVNGSYSSCKIFEEIILPQVIKGDQQMLQTMDSILTNQHVKVEFTENYLVTPISCIILTGLIKEIKEKYNLQIDNISLNLDYCLCDNKSKSMSTQYIRFKFSSQIDRDIYIRNLMVKELGVQPSLAVNMVDHHRWLRFTNPSGQFIEIRPDHGIGACWCNDCINHGMLANLRLPINFRKNIKYGGPEPTVIYYVVYDKN